MALFGKKVKACAVCGKETKAGFLKGLFQIEVDGQYVCNECFGVGDIQQEILNGMSIDEFRKYVAFRDENQKLKDIFRVSNEVSMGFAKVFCFDMQHGLFCMDKKFERTIFEAKHIKSFVIKEDESTIFAGSANGLETYPSYVLDYLNTIYAEVSRYRTELQIYEMKLKLASEAEKDDLLREKPVINVQEPLRKFQIEIYFDHPYWNVYKADVSAPVFDHNDPQISRYMANYKAEFAKMENLAHAFMNLSFSK